MPPEMGLEPSSLASGRTLSVSTPPAMYEVTHAPNVNIVAVSPVAWLVSVIVVRPAALVPWTTAAAFLTGGATGATSESTTRARERPRVDVPTRVVDTWASANAIEIIVFSSGF